MGCQSLSKSGGDSSESLPICCLNATKNFQQHKVSLTLVLSNNSQQIECNVFFIEAILNEACVIVVSSHSVSVIPCSVLLRELLLANTV